MTDIPRHYFRGRDGARLAYRELGLGRPLIMIHGYTGTAMSMIDTGIPTTIAGRGYRVILPDLRGHGDGAVRTIRPPTRLTCWPTTGWR